MNILMNVFAYGIVVFAFLFALGYLIQFYILDVIPTIRGWWRNL